MSAGAVFITLVIAMFPGLFLVALAVKLWEIREAGRWPETTGKIVASRVRSVRKRPDDSGYGFSDTQVTNEPFVQYEYTVGGRTHRCSRVSIGERFDASELEAVLERYPVGKSVTVYYDPAKPDRALLERTLPAGPMAAGFGCLMAFFLGGPLIAAALYFDAVGWLRTRIADPSRAPIVVVLSGFGLAAVLFALATRRIARRAASWPVARGRIVESDVDAFRPQNDPDDTFEHELQYRPRVVYSYEVNGRTYSGDRLKGGTIVSSNHPDVARRAAAKHPVGGEVEVYYNPDAPGESVLHPRSAAHHVLWGVAAAMFALAWALATGRLG